MERKVVVVCSVVGLLGLLSAALGFVAEAIRIADSQGHFVSPYHCGYPRTLLPPLFGIIAALVLAVSQIVLNVSAGCICCRKSPRFPDSNWGVALLSFILSWFTFVFAFLLLLLTGFGFYYCKPGAVTRGAILALASSAFGVVYYLTLTAAGNNGSYPGGDSSYPNQGGIALGQPQIPEISQDPVFVHEDTHIRRQQPQIPEISQDPVFVHEDTHIRRQFT